MQRIRNTKNEQKSIAYKTTVLFTEKNPLCPLERSLLITSNENEASSSQTNNTEGLVQCQLYAASIVSSYTN